jgi:hypothetical protein
MHYLGGSGWRHPEEIRVLDAEGASAKKPRFLQDGMEMETLGPTPFYVMPSGHSRRTTELGRVEWELLEHIREDWGPAHLHDASPTRSKRIMGTYSTALVVLKLGVLREVHKHSNWSLDPMVHNRGV